MMTTKVVLQIYIHIVHNLKFNVIKNQIHNFLYNY